MNMALTNVVVVLVLLNLSCEAGEDGRRLDSEDQDSASGAETDSGIDSESNTGADSDADSDSDNDSDSGVDESPYGTASLFGVVKSATGFPISGALVYLTDEDGPEVPAGAYCYECDEVPKGRWALSNHDGTWNIETAPVGTTNIITRKGGFQRQRQISIAINPATQNVPEELTTLPGENSADGRDQIPSFAVLLNRSDNPENLLAKMGLGDTNNNGKLIPGTEQFDVYNDDRQSIYSVGEAESLFANQQTLNKYHMVFFPCTCLNLTVNLYKDMLSEYVAAGGRLYGSCYAGHWVEKPFPDVIDFRGNDENKAPGMGDSYDTHGIINDPDMREWLQVVSPNEDPDFYPVREGYINILSVSDDSYDGHGVLINDDGSTTIAGPVKPIVWVTDNEYSPSSPLTLTFDYDCGKVFYSTFHVVTDASTEIAPQEWALIYLFYEVGVCVGEHEEISPV